MAMIANLRGSQCLAVVMVVGILSISSRITAVAQDQINPTAWAIIDETNWLAHITWLRLASSEVSGTPEGYAATRALAAAFERQDKSAVKKGAEKVFEEVSEKVDEETVPMLANHDGWR